MATIIYSSTITRAYEPVETPGLFLRRPPENPRAQGGKLRHDLMNVQAGFHDRDSRDFGYDFGLDN